MVDNILKINIHRLADFLEILKRCENFPMEYVSRGKERMVDNIPFTPQTTLKMSCVSVGVSYYK